MPGKKRFASRAEEEIQRKRAGLANAASRRLGGGLGGRTLGGGRVSGGGLGAAASQAADRTKRFQPLGGGSTIPTTGGLKTPGGPTVPGREVPPGLKKKNN